jgi:predicted Zn-dependent protease
MDDVVSALGGALDGAAAKPSLEQQLALLKGAPVSPDKERALRELVAAFPKRIEAHVALASFHNGGQRSDLAAEALRAATAALPESGKVRYLLGVALKQSGKLAEARAAFGEALRLGVEEKDRIQVETLLNDMKG